MPIFEFKCAGCGSEFEELVLSCSDSGVRCPSCKSDQTRKLISTGNIRAQGIPKGKGGFKGSGPACRPGGG
jgi:putative FmdB family regulatory protein